MLLVTECGKMRTRITPNTDTFRTVMETFTGQPHLLNHNQFHNISRLFNVLPNFAFTASKTMGDYYL